MSIRFSSVVAAQPRRIGRSFSALSVEMGGLGQLASPVAALDEFRVSAPTFGPHPHAGFSAVTYVLEGSQGAARSRDSLGNDIVVGPGGIVWTQAGSGAIHEESPAEPGRELHGLQIFVNLGAKRKLSHPRVFSLESTNVPEWRKAGDVRVRVVVGSFEGVKSPLIPEEPFDLLDVELRTRLDFKLAEGHNALVYVLKGAIGVVSGDGREQKVDAEHAMAIGGGGDLAFIAHHSSQFVILSGAAITEPVVAHGPFIMNDRAQVDAALARFRSGAMGNLPPRMAG